jgi:C-terminal processing protease CtpA/Prc
MDGIRITAVAPGSPAEKAGVRPDDVIVGATTEKDPLANFSPNTPDVPALLKVLDGTRNFLWLMVARGGAYHQVEPVRIRFGKDPPDA